MIDVSNVSGGGGGNLAAEYLIIDSGRITPTTNYNGGLL